MFSGICQILLWKIYELVFFSIYIRYVEHIAFSFATREEKGWIRVNVQLGAAVVRIRRFHRVPEIHNE